MKPRLKQQRWAFALASAVGLACAIAPGAMAQDAKTMEEEIQKTLNLRGALVVKLDVDPHMGLAMRLGVPVGEKQFTLDLLPYSVRDEGYTLWEQQADSSWIQLDPGPINTFRGEVIGQPGSIVAGGILPDGLCARILIDDATDYWIEPIAGRVKGAEPGMHVVYTTANLIGPRGDCGNITAPNLAELAEEGKAPAEGGAAPRGLFLYTAQLACDSDWEYFQRYGGAINVQNRIAAVTNTMNVQYEREVNITHVITTTLTRSSSAADPYTTTDAATLNVQVENEWNGQNGITRDVIQLFTHTDINGNTIGRANHIGAICTAGGDPNCFVWSDFNGNFMSATDLSAHELGHLWDASHCTCTSPDSTMNPSITSINRFTFAPNNNIQQIVDYRGTRNCLSLGVGLQPPHDNCADAVDVSTGRFGFSNVSATTDESPVPGACGQMGADVWYRFRTQCAGTLSIDTCNTANEQGFDTVLALYTGSCGDLTQVACNDDDTGCTVSSPARRSGITYQTSANTVYFIRVGGYDGATGSGILNITHSNCLELVNDTCSGAITVSACDGDIEFNTNNADSDGFIEQNDCNASGSSQIFNDTWYRYVAPCTGVVRLSTCGANFDTKMAVYTSCPSNPNLALACNDDNGVACAGLDASLEFNGIRGADYYIRIGAYSQTGRGSGSLIITPPCPTPSNDSCGNATVVSIGATPFSTLGACTSATVSNNCTGDGGTLPNDVWFRWVAPACSGPVTIDVCDATFDTKLAIYTACPRGTATAVACNDDACGTGGLRSRVSFTATANEDYLIRIGGSGGQTGTGTLNIAFSPAAPSNNACSSPTILGNGSHVVSNCGATRDGPSTGCEPGYNDVWFIYQASCTGMVTVSTCSSYSFDTVLFAYTAASGCPVSNASIVACNDNACGLTGRGSRITFNATAGERYRIRLASATTTGEGTATLQISCSGECPCDWNEDATLNSQDFFDFLNAFFGGSADFNGNGVTNSQDFFDFLNCFFAPPPGCG